MLADFLLLSNAEFSSGNPRGKRQSKLVAPHLLSVVDWRAAAADVCETISVNMPERRTPSKRKAPDTGHSLPPTSKVKGLIDENTASVPGFTPSFATTGGAVKGYSKAATKFIVALAAQLTSGDDEHDNGRAALMAKQDVLRVALTSLPEGKLKAELKRNEAATLERLAAAVRPTGEHDDPSDGTREERFPQAKKAASARKRGGGNYSSGESVRIAGIQPDGLDVVPCTLELYNFARASARKASADSGQRGAGVRLLRSLAVNPRASLGLLVDALQASGDDLTSAGVQQAQRSPTSAAVDALRTLVTALVADPGGAISLSGLAFYADRAAAFASAVVEDILPQVAERGSGVSGGDADADEMAMKATATEALGLMLRVLQLAGLALSFSSSTSLSHLMPLPVTGVRGTEDTETGLGVTNAADRLLLPCLPLPSSRVVAAAGGKGLQQSRRSVARLLAYYSALLAICSEAGTGGASTLIKSVRMIAAVGTISSGGNDVDDDDSSSSSSSSEDESDGEEDVAKVNGTATGGREAVSGLSTHLITLCAGNLAGDEEATLEFLRCVGDAVFVPREGTAQPLLQSTTVAASLAPTCTRVLARLPRPSASPAPTATQYLRRAYASRVVAALNQKAVSALKRQPFATSSIKRISTSTSTDILNAPRPWDFVGAAPAPSALLEFLGRPEAPIAVGDGPAGAALSELASRRRNPAAVGDCLRSAAACAPAGLGPLLTAMEGLSGAVPGNGSDGEPDAARETKAEETVGGFFVDTGGAHTGGAADPVLAPLGGGGDGGRDFVGMDEDDGESTTSD